MGTRKCTLAMLGFTQVVGGLLVYSGDLGLNVAGDGDQQSALGALRGVDRVYRGDIGLSMGLSAGAGGLPAGEIGW